MHISLVALKTTDSYDQHQAIWSLFPDTPERKRDHLFRVESEKNGQLMVLLQSSSAPQTSEHAKVIQSKPLKVNLTNGDYYKFKLLANPTKCLSQGKKVIELQEEAEQVQWLQRKLSGANVTVTSIDSILVPSRKCCTSRFFCFEGILQVTNAEQINTVLVMGVGRKKHAGAGLLSLARAS